MRLACIYLPAFPLQIAVREQPDLAGQAVVVLGTAPRAEVVACSRAAFHAGVRPGMSPSQARARIGDLAVVPGAPGLWRSAIADLVGAIHAVFSEAGHDVRVDWSEAVQGERASTHPALFVEVPAGQRSERFGRRLLEVVTGRGLSGRVGVAADRFTARAAARTRGSSPVVVVSRAAAASFLAPLSIDLLPLRDEVRALLRAAGVHTLGQFAALPPPSIDYRAAGAVDYQELARGKGPGELSPAAPLLPRRPLPAPPRHARRTDGQRELPLAC
jgi:nucleotidyltransferase/DNA polymerase involved in DNA repair